MIALIPAAGYATRLYPLTKDRPKALLEVKNQFILSHIFHKIEELEDVKKIVIVTNSNFHKKLSDWMDGYRPFIPTRVLDDGTTSNENRLGAIGDKVFAIEHEKINDDILDISADNLFSFSLKGMHEYFKKKNAPVIALYDVGSKEEAKKMGIVEIDAGKKIIGFQEKPSEPRSTLASIGIYMYPKSVIPLFENYLAEGNKPDNPGYFIEWLHKKTPVFGYSFKETPEHKWFDIGSFDALEQAQKEFPE